MNKAIYAGTFSPLHQGHKKVIEKALKIFDFIYVVVSINPEKNNADTLEIRAKEVSKELANYKNIEVITSNKLTIEIAKEKEVHFLIRSARNQTDYEYELKMSASNKKLDEGIETILIIPDYEDINFSSTLEKQKRGF